MNKYQEALANLNTMIGGKDFETLHELVNMHEQPLKLEEIKSNMWVWDNKEKIYFIVLDTLEEGKTYSEAVVRECDVEYGIEIEKPYEDNRFYRYQPLSEV